MALIIPPGFGQVLLPFKHEALARSALVTYGLDLSDVGGDYAQTANLQPVIFTNNWGTELDSQVTVGPATIRVGQDGGDPLSVEGSDTQVGEESSGMLPPNCALLVRKATSLGGRRGRGRCYIPWVTQENAVDDVGTLDGGSLTARQSDATNWLLDLQAGTTGDFPTPMVILHDSSGAGVEPSPSVVTGLNVDALIATQRRRLGR
jgi:hypothetical protein